MQNVYANGIVCHRAHHGTVQILACSDNSFKVYGVGVAGVSKIFIIGGTS
jgi:hypothetical protein